MTITGPAGGRRRAGAGERQAGRQRRPRRRARCRAGGPDQTRSSSPGARATRVRSSSYARRCRQLVQRHPGDGADLDVGVGQLAALGPQQEVVHGLVHPPAVGHEPEVDRAQPADDPPGDAGLLGDLADGRLLGALAGLDVPLGQRPEHPSAPVLAGRSARPPARPDEVSTTSPPADVSSTRRTRGRRGRAMPSIVSVGRHRVGGRPASGDATTCCSVGSDGRVHVRVFRLGSRDLARGPRAGAPRPPTSSASVFAARRPRAAPGRRLGPGRAARPARPTTSTSPPTPGPSRCWSWSPGWAEATWTTGIEFGTVGVLVRGAALRDHHLPRRPVRPGQPQPAWSRTATRWPTTCAGATSP